MALLVRQAEPEAFKGMTKLCTHCSSTNNTYCYLDNGKQNQPRYRCLDCGAFFAVVDHGRKHGKKYAKKRNVDPEELRDLPRECPKCKCGDHVPFKYYNNKCPTQPVFKCLKCTKRFQMRVEFYNGTERRLVHTGRAAQGQIHRAPRRNTCSENTVACSGMHHELPSEMVMNMADSLLEFRDVYIPAVDIFDGALAKMGFDDQAPATGLIPNESMFDDEIDLSDFTLPRTLPDDINPDIEDEMTISAFAAELEDVPDGDKNDDINPTPFCAATDIEDEIAFAAELEDVLDDDENDLHMPF